MFFILSFIILYSISSKTYADKIIELSPISFGILEINNSNTNHIVIDPLGNNLSTSSSLYHNKANRGHYQIFCNNQGVAILDFKIDINTNINFSKIKAYYNNSILNSFPATITINDKFPQNLYIGGTLEFSNSSALGMHNIGLYIDLNCPK